MPLMANLSVNNASFYSRPRPNLKIKHSLTCSLSHKDTTPLVN